MVQTLFLDRPSMTTSRRRNALRVFCESFPDNISFDLRLNVERLEPSVLLLALLDPRHQRHVHAKLAAPLVERRRTDRMLPAQIRNRRAGLRPIQHRQDGLPVNLDRFI